MPIVGKIDLEVLKQRQERSHEVQVAYKENQRRVQAAKRRANMAKKASSFRPFQDLESLSSELCAKQEEETKLALRRRDPKGRFISRKRQAEAIATADKLQRLGFGS